MADNDLARSTQADGATPRAPREVTVFFATDNHPRAGEFGLGIAKEFLNQPYEVRCFYQGADDPQSTDWSIGWIDRDNGLAEPWLAHVASGQVHFLGTDSQQAIRSACRLISEWDKELFAVQ